MEETTPPGLIALQQFEGILTVVLLTSQLLQSATSIASIRIPEDFRLFWLFPLLTISLRGVLLLLRLPATPRLVEAALPEPWLHRLLRALSLGMIYWCCLTLFACIAGQMWRTERWPLLLSLHGVPPLLWFTVGFLNLFFIFVPQSVRMADSDGEHEAKIGDAECPHLARLTKHVWQSQGGATEEEEVCTICLGELRAGERLRRLHCGHAYHDACIVPWIRGGESCPLRCDLDHYTDPDPDPGPGARGMTGLAQLGMHAARLVIDSSTSTSSTPSSTGEVSADELPEHVASEAGAASPSWSSRADVEGARLQGPR